MLLVPVLLPLLVLGSPLNVCTLADKLSIRRHMDSLSTSRLLDKFRISVNNGNI